jgi:polysaccharide pyruvyl transferase WcaK-like protein
MSGERILIVNVHSSLNAGDLALLECTIRQMRANFDQPRIVLVPNWPDEEYFRVSGCEIVPSPWELCGLSRKRLIHQVASFSFGTIRALTVGKHSKGRAKHTDRWENLFEAYRQADLVVGVAGNQFYSTGKYGWPFPVSIMAVGLAHRFSKPFYTMPQSIGPLRRRWERALLRGAYRRARLIQVRDEFSRDLVSVIGVPSDRVVYSPDPAFDYPPAPSEQALELLSKYGFTQGKPSLGVSVISSMGRTLRPGAIKSYYQVIANGLRRFLEAQPARVYLFSQVSGPTSVEDDREGCALISQMLNDLGERVVMIDGVLPPSMLKACYGLMDFYVASRLHSGIFSVSMNVPTLFIGYLAKTRGVLRSLGHEDWVIDLDQFSEDAFYVKLTRAWQNREAMREELEQIMPPVIQQVQQAGRRIAEDFNRHARTH